MRVALRLVVALLVIGRLNQALSCGEVPTVAVRLSTAGAAFQCHREPRRVWLHRRISYYSNSVATFQPYLLIQSGDVEANPGPVSAAVRPAARRARPPPAPLVVSCIAQNVRSVRNKLHTLRSHAGDLQSFDVVAITESWLTAAVDDSELQVGWPAHSWFRLDRDGRGGGVAAAVRSSLCPTRRTDLEPPNCELLAVQLCVGSPVIVAVCYRPPSADTQVQAILDFAARVRQLDHPLLLVGDMNLPEIYWPEGAPPVLSQQLRRAVAFVDGVNDLGLDQSVREPTRNGAVLDLVLSCGGVARTDVRPGTFESDHRETVTYFSVRGASRLRVSRTVAFNYRAADFAGLRAALRLLPWNVLDSLDLNAATELFYDWADAAIRNFIPTVELRSRYPPWFTYTVRQALCAKEAAYRRKRSYPSQDNERLFSDARRRFKVAANTEYRSYLLGLVGDFRTNSKRFWSFLKSLKFSCRSIPTLTYEGHTFQFDEDKANCFNICFSRKFSEPTVDCLPATPELVSETLRRFEIPHGAVERLLLELNPHKACGPDGISGRILRECAREIAVPLEILCRMSIDQGVFPDLWKRANIVPVHKKGDKRSPDNYRPVSLLPLCSKVLERLVYDSLLSHCLPGLPRSQHGFLRKRSCISNLACFLNHAWGAVGEGVQTDAVYTDYSSAFTSVNHRLLLYKLKQSFSVTDKAYAWLESYLSNRCQRVVHNGRASVWTPVKSGVPEGSICGPLLFICYTADIPSIIKTNCIMYADDLKLYNRVTCSEDAALLQTDLSRLAEWSEVWKLKLNPKKCFVISYTLKTRPVIIDYQISNVSLQRRTEARDLGVILDEKLTFARHVDVAVGRARRMLGVLIRGMQQPRNLRGGAFDFRALRTAYFAHVRSILEYGSVIWAGAAVTHLKRMERVQHTFLIWLASCSNHPTNRLDYEHLLTHFQIPSIKSRLHQHDLLFLYKIFHGQIDCPELVAYFPLSAPSRRIRKVKLWHIPFARVNTIKNSMFIRIPTSCNALLTSDSSVDFFASTLASFKSAVASFGLSSGVY